MDMNSAFADSLAAQVRAERGAQKLSVRELSERSGVPFETLKRYVAGSRDIPASRLYDIATGLGVSVSELVARAEQRANQEGTT